MFYRFNQLYNAIFAKVEQQEYIWLNTILESKELALFQRQALTEQRHALDVAYDLEQNKQEIIKTYGKVVYHNLLLAALLHDCGKSLIKLRLWQRIVIVTTGYLPKEWKKKISKHKNLLGKTLVIYEQHPAWGKRLAAKAGLNEDVQLLIREHHSPANPLGQILFEADNRH